MSSSRPVSFDAGSSVKALQMPITNQHDLTSSPIHGSPSGAHEENAGEKNTLKHLQSNSPAEDKDAAKERTKEWNAFRDAIVGRVNNINVVASLFITAAAVFLSTVSPDKKIVDWGTDVCFYITASIIAVAIQAVLVGCIISYIFMDLRTEDLRYDCKRRHFPWIKIALILFLLCAHTALMIMALGMALVAISAAVLNGTSVLMRVVLGFLILSSTFYILVVGVFILVVRPDSPPKDGEGASKV
ncbi:hypothetical protein FRB94_012531 [Tulasnella sp. JGI-2019a]|nr:hypothetical protein FRB93_006921 [Tulasnella sp. JGI-2019a]KAG8991404.1 hypothetical protein FRB94_012531 [Tulasnella sp. JGI-2019a]